MCIVVEYNIQFSMQKSKRLVYMK